jgi:hypothetical protein
MPDPLIAVIGSVQPSRANDIRLKDPAEGEKAAEVIGHALAKRKCRLVAYSAAELSVEHLVVRGYVAECNSNPSLKDFAREPGRIEVPYSANDPRPEFPELQSNPEPFFHFQADRNPSWASSFYRSLSTLDAVIFMGGSYTTYVAGTVAISHRKPVAPLLAFGGAAEDLWKELSPEPGVLEQDQINLLTSRPNIETAGLLIDNLLGQQKKISEKRRLANVTKQWTPASFQVLVALPFLVAAMIAVPFTWDNPDLQRTTLLSILLFSPLLAGISGATARITVDAFGGNVSESKSNLLRTAGLGAIAGAVAGLLFIIAQLVAMSPEIGAAIWSKQAGRLVPFAVIIGFIAGFTLDAVFRRLAGVNVITDEMLKTLTERVNAEAGQGLKR